jgi:ABC-2 type transport system permease protein
MGAMTFWRKAAHVLSLCWHYGVQKQKVDMAYRGDWLFSIVISLMYTGLQLFFLSVLFTHTRSLGGWSLPAVILMFGFSQLSFGYFSVAFFELANKLADFYILEGNLDRPLLRPFSPLAQLVMENVNLRDLQIVVKGIAIVWWALAHLSPPVAMTPLIFIGANLLAVIGAAIYAAVFLTVCSLNFWVKDRVGLVNPLFSVNEASRYPLTIYDPPVRAIFTWVIPFAFCAFHPAAYFIDPAKWGRWLLLGPVVAAAGLAVGLLIFNRGLRVYESTGS